jgi:acylphosphatase
MAAERRRLRVEIQGAVQGVGFRPYIYRLATELGLAGWVRNDPQGVFIEVEGPPHALARASWSASPGKPLPAPASIIFMPSLWTRPATLASRSATARGKGRKRS